MTPTFTPAAFANQAKNVLRWSNCDSHQETLRKHPLDLLREEFADTAFVVRSLKRLAHMQRKGGKQMAKRGRGRPRRSSNEGSNFEVILDRLREAFNEQYQRGSDDAMRQILSVAQGGGSTGSRAVTSKPAGGKKKRAPRGTAKSLVERVLASGA